MNEQGHNRFFNLVPKMAFVLFLRFTWRIWERKFSQDKNSGLQNKQNRLQICSCFHGLLYHARNMRTLWMDKISATYNNFYVMFSRAYNGLDNKRRIAGFGQGCCVINYKTWR